MRLTPKIIEGARWSAIEAIRSRDASCGGPWISDHCDNAEKAILSALDSYQRVEELLNPMPSGGESQFFTRAELRRALYGEE